MVYKEANCNKSTTDLQLDLLKKDLVKVLIDTEKQDNPKTEIDKKRKSLNESI